jgi:hypothetical protein
MGAAGVSFAFALVVRVAVFRSGGAGVAVSCWGATAAVGIVVAASCGISGVAVSVLLVSALVVLGLGPRFFFGSSTAFACCSIIPDIRLCLSNEPVFFIFKLSATSTSSGMSISFNCKMS